MEDAPLYKQRRRYTRELHDVDLHGNHKLHVVFTSKGQDVVEMLSTLKRKLGGMPVKLVGVDVEPMELEKFLMNDEYTFAGFAIEGDKNKLKLSGLEINYENYIDIQVEWRDPYNKKKFGSLADVAGKLLDIHYHDMKNKINRTEDHTLLGFCPLPDKLIKYATVDAFATYESWRIVYDVIMGLDIAKEKKK
ncbi:hypothetical protein VPH35_065807 [Triticum aestivum]